MYILGLLGKQDWETIRQVRLIVEPGDPGFPSPKPRAEFDVAAENLIAHSCGSSTIRYTRLLL
jgi:hypothetical protein